MRHDVSKVDPKRLIANAERSFGKLSSSQEAGLLFLVTNPAINGALVTQLAYMLATTWHETATTMRPIAEYGGAAYANARYDCVLGSTAARRSRAKKMGNTARGDGYKYRGRGYVQLTWKVNYKKFSALLGVDLVGDPALAMVPEHALRVMVTGMRDGLFTGAKLGAYINETNTNYVRARRVINGVDKASTIAKYANLFARCLGT